MRKFDSFIFRTRSTMQLAGEYIFLTQKRVLHGVVANGPAPTIARLEATPRDFYWDSGLQDYSEVVLIYASTCQEAKADWTGNLLDQTAADRHINLGQSPAGIKLAHYANILRTFRLKRWADVKTFGYRLLSDWPPLLMLHIAFFGSARPCTRLIETYTPRTLVYWRGHWYLRQAYLRHHDLVETILRDSLAPRCAWNHMSALCWTRPHLLQRVFAGVLAEEPEMINSPCRVLVHKMNCKCVIRADDVFIHLGRI